MGYSKNQRTKRRKHRRMEEARQMVSKLSNELNQPHTDEERAQLREKLIYWSFKSTRKANNL